VWLEGRLEHGSRVTVAGVPAAVSWLGGGFHQLRCEQDPGLAAGEAVEVAGAPGRVLEAGVPKHGPSNDLLVRLTRLRDGQDPNARRP
jgi:hypothetical protein